MSDTVKGYIEANREKLKDFAGSQLFFDWSELALEQGMDAEQAMVKVMQFNVEGGK